MFKKRGRIVAGTIETTSKPYIQRQTWAAPAADATNNMFSVATVAGSAIYTLANASITDPDFPRTVCVFATGTAAHISAGQCIINGTDIDDNTITDTITALTLNTVSTVYSTKAFKTVTSVIFPKMSDTSVQFGIGGGPSLGLDRKCEGGVGAIVGAWKTTTGETTAAVATSDNADVSLCTMNFSTAYDGAATYGCWFVTDDVR